MFASRDRTFSALVMGMYGCGNKGDDGILESIINNLSPKIKIIVTCGGKNDLNWLGIKTTRCRLNENLTMSVLVSMCVDVLKILFNLIKTDALIIGGGALLHDKTFYNLPFWFLFHNFARVFKKKIYYISIGIGPISTKAGEYLCKKYLSSANQIFVRDKHGAEILNKLAINNVKITADVALAMDTDLSASDYILKELSLHEKKYISITLCKHFAQENYYKNNLEFKKEKAILANALQKIYEKYKLPFVFLPTEAYDYELGLEMCKLLKSKCEFYVVSTVYNSKELASIIAAGKYLIAVRMHSMIFATRASIPFITFVYDTKVQSFLEMVEMSRYSIPIEELDSSRIYNLFAEMVKNEDVVKENLKRATIKLSYHVRNSISYISNEILSC